MLYDAQARTLLARERAALLRSEAALGPGDRRARRWLSDRLIAAGVRLADERATPVSLSAAPPHSSSAAGLFAPR